MGEDVTVEVTDTVLVIDGVVVGVVEPVVVSVVMSQFRNRPPSSNDVVAALRRLASSEHVSVSRRISIPVGVQSNVSTASDSPHCCKATLSAAAAGRHSAEEVLRKCTPLAPPSSHAMADNTVSPWLTAHVLMMRSRYSACWSHTPELLVK